MATKEELKEKFSTGKVPTGDDFAELIDGVKGDKGEKGDTGAAGRDGTNGTPGAKGEPGKDGTNGATGKDGFGTEAQYDDIISRLEAIEVEE